MTDRKPKPDGLLPFFFPYPFDHKDDNDAPLSEGELKAWYEDDVMIREIERAFAEVTGEHFAEDDPNAAVFMLGATTMRDVILRRIAARMTNEVRSRKRATKVAAFRESLGGRRATPTLARVFLSRNDADWYDGPDSERDAKVATLLRQTRQKK